MSAQPSEEASPLTFRAVCIGSLRAARLAQIPERDWSPATRCGAMLEHMSAKSALLAIRTMERTLIAISTEEGDG